MDRNWWYFEGDEPRLMCRNCAAQHKPVKPRDKIEVNLKGVKIKISIKKEFYGRLEVMKRWRKLNGLHRLGNQTKNTGSYWPR